MESLRACLRRIALERYRDHWGTLCEMFSHFILLLTLAASYALTTSEAKFASHYDSFNVHIPPPFPNQYTSFRDTVDQYNRMLHCPLMVPTLDQYVQLGDLLSLTVAAEPNLLRLLTATGFAQSITNLLYRGALHVSPNDERTSALVQYLNATYTSFANFPLYIHESEDVGVDYILSHLSEPTFALIHVQYVTSAEVHYKIRQNFSTLPNTNYILHRPAVGIHKGDRQYLLSGFFSLRQAIDEWVFHYVGASDNRMYPELCSNGPKHAALVPFPTSPYQDNAFYEFVPYLLGLLLVMSTVYPFSRLIKSIVEEKETKMRELMMIMGLPQWVLRASWTITGFVGFTWLAFTQYVVCAASFWHRSNSFLLFLFLLLFALSEMTFALLLSVFFSKSKLAAIAGPVMLFASIMPRYIFINTTSNELVLYKVLACLLSPTAFAFGADIISDYEHANVGVQYPNLFFDRFNFSTVLAMLLVDICIYGLLAWYLDQVLPNEHGTLKQPFFWIFDWQHCLLTYVCSCCRWWCTWWRGADIGYTVIEDEETSHDSRLPEFVSAADVSCSPAIEPLNEDLLPRATVRILALTKQFADGKVAVDNLSLALLQGQITCLLGHNGAGKTTTISMLTGLVQMTSGDVSIYGHSLRHDLQSVRRITGLCPQLNVLFPLLTVEEHLHFFGIIKGLHAGAELREACSRVLVEVGLTDKRHALSQTLSGGMKRKLCLAMALLGDPQFILLDEPTSGMDPVSRQRTWELLQRCKMGRVILLTTHYMDEADILADRVAIMSEGALFCVGSPSYLKRMFGVGYLLSVSKSDPLASMSRMSEAIQQIVPEASVHSSVVREVIFRLPQSTLSSFGRLFQMLRDRSEELGIASYGFRAPSMEQVFLSLKATSSRDGSPAASSLYHTYVRRWLSSGYTWLIGYVGLILQWPASSDDGDNVEQDYGNTVPTSRHFPPAPSSNEDMYGTSNCPHWKIQLFELCRKRVIVLRGDFQGFLCQILCPAVLIVLILRILTVRLNISGSPLPLNANMYHRYGQVVPTILVPDTARSPLVPSIHAYADSNRFIIETAPPQSGINSSTLSRFLLSDAIHDGRKKRTTMGSSDRHGAFVFPDDELALHVTIDWDWVGSMLTKHKNLSIESTEGAVVFKFSVNGTLLPLVSPSFLSQLGRTLPFSYLWKNHMNGMVANNSYHTSRNHEVFGWPYWLAPLLASFNVSSAKANLTVNHVENNDLMLSFHTENDMVTFNLHATEVSIPVTNMTSLHPIATAFDATVRLSHESISLSSPRVRPEVEWTIVIRSRELYSESRDLFLSLLPKGSIQYTYNIPSKLTLLHNTTSPHGAAALHGQLVEATFHLCMQQHQPTTQNTTALHRSDPDAVSVETANTNNSRSFGSRLPRYTVENHPLPITAQQSLQVQVILSLLTSLFLLVPFGSLPATCVACLVKERVSKSKHLQRLSGVSMYVYWLAAFLWDMSLFALLVFFVLGSLFVLVGHGTCVFISSSSQTLAFFCLLMCYAAAALPFAYLCSLIFSHFATAQIAIVTMNFLTGFVLIVAYSILSSLLSTQRMTNEILVHVFRLFPGFVVGEGLIHLSIHYFEHMVGVLNDVGTAALDTDEDAAFRGVWHWEVVGRDLVFLFMQSVVFMSMVLWSESTHVRRMVDSFMRYWRRRCSVDCRDNDGLPCPSPRVTSMDGDVKREEELVCKLTNQLLKNKHTEEPPEDELLFSGESHIQECEGGGTAAVVLLIDQLVKTYASSICGGLHTHAVRGLSLIGYAHECLGLLGINGAGKTTTLEILAGEIQATFGDVRILVDGCAAMFQRQMLVGYCPQVDPLVDENMNAYETLWFYGRIRGITPGVLHLRIQRLIAETGLTSQQAQRPCGTYSGGNKRKLSLAIALLGDPHVLLLDEPSAGMDPAARRQMWHLVQQQVQQHPCTVILVGHCMEEIEALCSRVGVMVRGRLMCLGTIPHLKDTFGVGYQIEVRCGVDHVQACLALCADFFTINGNNSCESGQSNRRLNHIHVTVAEEPAQKQKEEESHFVIEDICGGYFRLREHDGHVVDLAMAFDVLERNKEALEIYDYSISQGSFEQVFLKVVCEPSSACDTSS